MINEEEHMNNRNCELLISSCEAYSDLWDIHIKLLNKNWKNRNIVTTIVTDCEHTGKVDPSVSVFAAGANKEMPQRIKKALEKVQTDYVLLTLDDYYLVEQIDDQKIDRLVGIMEKMNLDYIRMFPIPKETNVVQGYKNLFWIDLSRNYAVNLYPGLWRTDFLRATVVDSLNAWDYEVSLTQIARDEKILCVMSRGNDFPFLDVIRKGKILHKAKRYLDKEGFVIDRKVIPWHEEIKLEIMKNSKKLLPRRVQKYVKYLMQKMGMKFISKGI